MNKMLLYAAGAAAVYFLVIKRKGTATTAASAPPTAPGNANTANPLLGALTGVGTTMIDSTAQMIAGELGTAQ